jgi:N-dimethylarginine dimethylaminohydrolase
MSDLNQTVLMSNARYFSNDQPINPYYPPGKFDAVQANHEHQAIRHCFEEAGITVLTVESPVGAQDGVYTANWALVRGKRAVLARLPTARKIEEAWARQALEGFGIEVITIPHDWRSSGQGDALSCGNYLFCGSVYRSDLLAQDFIATTLGYERVQLQTLPQLDSSNQPVINTSSGWPDSYFYDIDMALSVIKSPTDNKKGLIAYCPEAFTKESRAHLEEFNGVDKIIVPISEAQAAFACNLVSTGKTVIMSPDAPVLRSSLENHGLNVVTVSAPELMKGGGYIRCVSLAFNN